MTTNREACHVNPALRKQWPQARLGNLSTKFVRSTNSVPVIETDAISDGGSVPSGGTTKRLTHSFIRQLPQCRIQSNTPSLRTRMHARVGFKIKAANYPRTARINRYRMKNARVRAKE